MDNVNIAEEHREEAVHNSDTEEELLEEVEEHYQAEEADN